jgi:pimeloyl-ACP methyl ester carboxylesterase
LGGEPIPAPPTTIPWMRTEWTPVAEGVQLATDSWLPDVEDRPQLSGGQAHSGGQAPAGGEGAASATVAGEVPFLLVHGLASNARLWDGVAAALVSTGHPAVSVDLRGHGRSSKPEGPYDVATVADDLAALIGRLPIDRPVAAGQSWGGNVVVELAARHPGLVRGIVCVDGGWLEPSRQFADWDACRAALAPPRLVGRRLEEVEQHVRSAHPDWPETGIRGVLANFEVRPDGTIAPWLTFDHHIAILRGLWEHHPRERYADLAIPVLLVPAEGGDPEWTARKRRDVEVAATSIPQARVRWLVGDHDLHAQHPRELASMMDAMTRDGFFR